MTISTSSGSIYPNKSLLNPQLYPEKSPRYNPQDISSKLLEKVVELPRETIVDLSRLGKVYANDKKLFDASDERYSLSGDSPVEQAAEIFDDFLMNCNDPEVAKNICNLSQQGLALDILKEITYAKGMRKTDNDPINYAFTAKETITVFNKDQTSSDIKFAQEQLYAQRSTDDPENGLTYFKAKIMVSGSSSSFAKRNMEQLDLKVAYTKEYRTLEEAKKANYFGTKAGGWSDSISYLSPEYLQKK